MTFIHHYVEPLFLLKEGRFFSNHLVGCNYYLLLHLFDNHSYSHSHSFIISTPPPPPPPPPPLPHCSLFTYHRRSRFTQFLPQLRTLFLRSMKLLCMNGRTPSIFLIILSRIPTLQTHPSNFQVCLEEQSLVLDPTHQLLVKRQINQWPEEFFLNPSRQQAFHGNRSQITFASSLFLGAGEGIV